MWESITLRQCDWDDLTRLEAETVRRVIENRELRTLLLFEPNPTFSRGVSAQACDLLWNADALEKKQINVATASRGGQWTYHGPGQVLIFPIVSLETLGLGRRDVRIFVELTRELIMAELASWGLAVKKGDDPYGIYVNQKKLAAFGFSCERGVMKHGVAVYRTSQTEYLAGINPCGQKEAITTSLVDEGILLPWEEVANRCLNRLKSGFQQLVV